MGECIKSGNFVFTHTTIEGVLVVETACFNDRRGSFMETYRKDNFAEGGITCNFVQDNQSTSCGGVLRGLHYQKDYPQAKLVRVTQGEVFDVAVDLRRESKTFGKWEGVKLSSENQRQFFIPQGFAHGFLVLSDYAEFCYKCSNVYHPNDEGGLIWNDKNVGISWPTPKGMDIVLSDKDKKHPSLEQLLKNEMGGL